MEDNDAQPTNVLDMIAMDAKPAEITDTLKNMIYAKAGEKIDGMKQYAAASYLVRNQKQLKNLQQKLKLKLK